MLDLRCSMLIPKFPKFPKFLNPSIPQSRCSNFLSFPSSQSEIDQHCKPHKNRSNGYCPPWSVHAEISEAREQDTQVMPYAEKVVIEIQGLLESGVPSQNISVVGASKGGVIASYVSLMLQENEINYVFLAGLFERCLADQDLSLYGKILSIHDSSDTLSITPDPFFERSSGQGVFKKIVVTKGLGHGLIYQPYSDWMEPLVDWIRQ